MATASDIPVNVLRQAAGRSDVVSAMRDFYARVDARIAREAPVCRNRGDCCRFGEYGHRLYVTTLEVAYYLAMGDRGEPLPGPDCCPHAWGGGCQARPRRFLGCRAFYCDPAAQAWQGPLTEDSLAELRRLHERLQVPYFYADWMTVLQALASEP